MEISPSDPSFDIHGGFQERFKIKRFQNRFCSRVKKVHIPTFIQLRKCYTHFLTYSNTELENNSGKMYSSYLNNGNGKDRVNLHSFLHAFA